MFKTFINDFITGFQFLTRIRIVNQTEWSQEGFARSVKFFPVIGAIVGLILAGIVYGMQRFCSSEVPAHILAIMVIVAELIITGGLHCDGFMDTVDGVFSGRTRERKLEIMKDSRVGAFGVMSFCLLVFVKYSFFMDMHPVLLPLAVFVMPITGRTGLVIAITRYNYARREGMGKIFYRCEHKNTLMIAGLFTLLLLGTQGKLAIISGMTGIVVAVLFCQYVNKQLNGLTGDVYGAVNEITEVAALLVFVCQ